MWWFQNMCILSGVDGRPLVFLYLNSFRFRNSFFFLVFLKNKYPSLDVSITNSKSLTDVRNAGIPVLVWKSHNWITYNTFVADTRRIFILSFFHSHSIPWYCSPPTFVYTFLSACSVFFPPIHLNTFFLSHSFTPLVTFAWPNRKSYITQTEIKKKTKYTEN